MRLLIVFIVLPFYCFKIAGQTLKPNSFTSFAIDTTLDSTLAKSKLKSEFNLPMIADGFWFFMNKGDYNEYVDKGDPIIFFDTLQTYTDVVCDCMIKKDTNLFARWYWL